MGRMKHGHRAKKAAGGEVVYEGKGSHDVKEAEDKKETFKRGGRAKRKDGGKVEGTKSHHRADRKPRASGGRVLSSAAKTTGGPKEGGTDKEDD